MIKNFFIPTKANKYSPRVLGRGAITLYTLLLLIFNIITVDIAAFQAKAAVGVQSLVELHNTERRKNGLTELTINSKLTNSALNKAQAMLESDCWDHYCPDNKSPWDFFEEAEYDYVYAGENLAEGFTDNEKVFSAWMNSKTHRENILRPEFDEIGIGIVYGRFQGIDNNAVIVVHFGSRHIGDKNNPSSNWTESNSGLDELIITNPQDNAVLNTNTPNINGTSPNGGITIKDGKNELGASIAKEGLFTFKVPKDKSLTDGSHTIKAEYTAAKLSDEVTIEIDTIPPVLQTPVFDSIIDSSEEPLAVFLLITSPDTISLQNDIAGAQFIKLDESTWEIRLPFDKIKDLDKYTVYAFDNASNKTTEKFDLIGIQHILSEHDSHYESANSINLIERIGLRRLINIIFITTFSLLILLNYYILAHTEINISLIKAKNQYHLSIFIILLIISFAGGTAGELLEAESI